MDTCRRGHPRNSENTYIHPVNGKRYCRVCVKLSKKNSTKRPAGKRSSPTPLTQKEVDALRELIRCVVCNAKPYGPLGQPSQTDHAPGCSVGNDLVLQKEIRLTQAREKAWATRRANQSTQRTDAA